MRSNGAHIALLFEKPSLRTRSTFEIAFVSWAAKRCTCQENSRTVRESRCRTSRATSNAGSARLSSAPSPSDKARTLAAAGTRLHVINALSDAEHPCQALADVLTLIEHWGDCQGRTVAYVGDGNNVATSLVHAAPQFGVSVHLATPRAYALPDEVIEAGSRQRAGGAQIRTFTDPTRSGGRRRCHLH